MRRDFALPLDWAWVLSKTDAGVTCYSLTRSPDGLVAARIFVGVFAGVELVCMAGHASDSVITCMSVAHAMRLGINYLVVGLAWADNDEDRPRRRTLPHMAEDRLLDPRRYIL